MYILSQNTQSIHGFLIRDGSQPFHDGGRYHIETSPLICSANQWTGFYMISASVMKGLIMEGVGMFPQI